MAAAVERMATGAAEITEALEHVTGLSKEASMHSLQVAAGTEEQLASMDEISAAAVSLSALAVELQNQVNGCRIQGYIRKKAAIT